MIGSYVLENDTLRFSQVAATKMACLKGMDTEDAFLKTLDQIRRWWIEGEHLMLTNEYGEILAQFEAVALP
jgi:heat shock protein HslJ